GPGPHAEALPRREVVVLDDRIRDAELLRRRDDLVVRLLPEELRRVHTDDRQSLPCVAIVPAPQLRDHVPTVHSPERPEVDEHDSPAEPLHRERLAVDPWAGRDLGRRPPRGDDLRMRANGNGEKRRRHHERCPPPHPPHPAPPHRYDKRSIAPDADGRVTAL